MSVCSRCKSENIGEIKFCNFCGARMRASISMDCYGTSDYSYQVAQAVPVSHEDEVNSKLAYRYFLKGRHAFSAGDLNRATLMFQCALDANPADQRVKAFLKRATEMKCISEPVDMAPLLRHDFAALKAPATADATAASESTSHIESAGVSAEGWKSDYSFTSDKEPVVESYKSQGPSLQLVKDDYNLSGVNPSGPSAFSGEPGLTLEMNQWDTQPLSPAALIDEAPSGEFFSDLLATLAAIGGIVIFGLVLTM